MPRLTPSWAFLAKSMADTDGQHHKVGGHRPLGLRRGYTAVPGGNLDDITAGEGASTGMKTFVEAVDQQIIPTALAQLVHPQAGGPIWPIALAWLTRDQERRFDDVLHGQSLTSDSDSPMPASGQKTKA